jgi:hypothetical protein
VTAAAPAVVAERTTQAATRASRQAAKAAINEPDERLDGAEA